MNKELFVSATPHEIKVGMVEDDQLAEGYLERENEYTLAGSIYKGRVTRVLPGMQSAFVDIGLERDAFLYVSDFMELENQDEDLDEVPIGRAIPDLNAQPEERAAEEPEEHSSQAESRGHQAPAGQPAAASRESSTPRDDRDHGSWRGRRRRGRRDQVARPAQTESRPEREQYGPPPGYQPIILPGESISKYRGRGQAATVGLGVGEETHSFKEEKTSGVSQSFPQDEPLFLEAADRASELEAERSDRARQDRLDSTVHEEETQVSADSRTYQEHTTAKASFAEPEADSEKWNREQKRQHERNVAAVFGDEAGEEDGDRIAE